MDTSHPLRRIRSFVRRQGRLTQAQQKALATLWPAFGIDEKVVICSLEQIFGRTGPKILEIGFGMGDSLSHMAQENPQTDYLGIEVHRPGVGHLLGTIKQCGIKNLRIINRDAVDALTQQLPDQAFNTIQMFFPDPWPKKRHYKRRLIQKEFVRLLIDKLKPYGIIHLATDWEAYAQHMLATLSDCGQLRNESSNGGFCPRPQSRPLTKFEERGQRLGHQVWDLQFKKLE